MQELLPNIFKVYRDPASGGWGYSYFVKRPQVNLFLARMAKTASIENEYDALDAMGGIQRIYITDFHFAGEYVANVAARFNAPVYCSEVELPKIKKRNIKSLTTFEYTPHEIEPGLAVIPTPGHTKGGVCYLLTLDGTRYLFTGDFLYFDGKKWIIGSKKYADVQESLARLQAAEYDYLVGCGDDELGCPYLAMTPATKTTFFATIARDFEQ